MEVILLIVSFFASIIGAICGIGGGVITKPVLDSLNLPGLGTPEASFLSSLSVLSMTIYSVSNVIRKKRKPDRHESQHPDGHWRRHWRAGRQSHLPGADRQLQSDRGWSDPGHRPPHPDHWHFSYTLFQEKIPPSLKIKSWLISLVVGLLLGISSSFLGIGGGPINLVILGFLFSMNPQGRRAKFAHDHSDLSDRQHDLHLRVGLSAGCQTCVCPADDHRRLIGRLDWWKDQ